MSRTQKLYAWLDRLEAELREMLIPALREVAGGRNTLFFITKHNNPWPALRGGSPQGTEIFERAGEILSLARRLGVDTSALLASKVVAAFEGANDLDNENRLGPIRLAQQLLAEITSSSVPNSSVPGPH